MDRRNEMFWGEGTQRAKLTTCESTPVPRSFSNDGIIELLVFCKVETFRNHFACIRMVFLILGPPCDPTHYQTTLKTTEEQHEAQKQMFQNFVPYRTPALQTSTPWPSTEPTTPPESTDTFSAIRNDETLTDNLPPSIYYLPPTTFYLLSTK